MISDDYTKMKPFIGKKIYTVSYNNKIEEHTVSAIKDTSYHGSEDLEFLTNNNTFLDPYGCYATYEEALCEIPKRIENKIKHTKSKITTLNEELKLLEEDYNKFLEIQKQLGK